MSNHVSPPPYRHRASPPPPYESPEAAPPACTCVIDDPVTTTTTTIDEVLRTELQRTITETLTHLCAIHLPPPAVPAQPHLQLPGPLQEIITRYISVRRNMMDNTTLTVKQACTAANIAYSTFMQHIKTAELYFLSPEKLQEVYEEQPRLKTLNKLCDRIIQREHIDARKRAVRRGELICMMRARTHTF